MKNRTLSKDEKSVSQKVNLRAIADRDEKNRDLLRRAVSSVGQNMDVWTPICTRCGVMSMVAGAALHAHIPVVATTAALAVAGCLWFMVNSDYNPIQLIKQHAMYGVVSTAIALPASLVAGPSGALVVGGVVLGAGLVGKFVDYMANTR